jgi:anti-sigma factor RsiW
MSEGHRHAWELIPWVINGRASAEERALVDAHLKDCADCRGELAFQRELQQGITDAPEPALDARAGLDRLSRRIDAAAGGEPVSPRSAKLVRWLAVAVVIEAIGLALLSTDVVFNARSAPYQTLTSSAPTASGASVRAVFAPQVPQSELQGLLQRNGLQIVAGPSEAGVYSLAIASNASAAEILAALRADPRVLFAEPVQ